MIFNEIYSAYYNTVAKIITAAVQGNADDQALNQIVCEHAFGESMLTVLPSLKSERWQLIKADLTTPIRYAPTLPLTTVQKQWLKAISLDPRIKLFGVKFDGLEAVEPLFTPEDYLIYDQYGDGDPYEDAGYIERFQTILQALKERAAVKLEMVNRKGSIVSMTLLPDRLEYSEKDDKFRLIGAGNRYGGTVNLGRMVSCERVVAARHRAYRAPQPSKDTVVLRVVDERNATERCLLHFAHFEKRAERVDENRYLVRIRYDRDDETELVIRILSFGPMVEVLEPQSFRDLIIDRLKKQKSCEL